MQESHLLTFGGFELDAQFGVSNASYIKKKISEAEPENSYNYVINYYVYIDFPNTYPNQKLSK